MRAITRHLQLPLMNIVTNGHFQIIVHAWQNSLRNYNKIDVRFSSLAQRDKGLSTSRAESLRHSNVLIYVLLH